VPIDNGSLSVRYAYRNDVHTLEYDVPLDQRAHGAEGIGFRLKGKTETLPDSKSAVSGASCSVMWRR
jgi:hypothetical protein